MPSRLERPLAFVDVETTGGNATRDRITEIAIIRWDGERAEAWSQLLDPQTRIPPFIETLTGITDAMLVGAPAFAELADDIGHRLAGHVLVAHNARFDYAFLKNEFRRVGIDFRVPVFCTVRYARRLFPDESGHSLDALISRHGLPAEGRHRALGDAQILFEFWRRVEAMFPSTHLEKLRQDLMAQPSLPPHVDADFVGLIPETPGVYLFFGDNDLPIYIGKAKQLRRRVLSHFAADHSAAKEMSLAQQVKRIEWQECAGEIEALLTEARLIKAMQPTLNRQLRRNCDFCAWLLAEDVEGFVRPRLVHARDLDFGRQRHLYGLFRTAREAKAALETVAREEGLCPVVLGLEKGQIGRPCFARQLKRCWGACCGAESLAEHSVRLLAAFEALRLQTWPHAGPALLAEGETLHVIDAWCHLGVVRDETEIAGLLRSGRPQFDRDTYRILVQHAERLRPYLPPA